MRGHLLVDVPLVALALAAYPALGWMAPVAAGGLSAMIHTWGVINPRSSLYMPVCWRLGPDAGGCALTYDDGPNPEVTPRLLDCLSETRSQATFFLIGSHVRREGALVRRIRAEGHALGLHSDTHSRLFNCWGPARVRADLEACGTAISQATGEPPPRLFRPPVGLKNPMVGWVSTRMGLSTVTWTARGRDIHARSAAPVLARLEPHLRAGSILLLHDGHEPTRAGERGICLEVTRSLTARMHQLGLVSRGLTCAGTSTSVSLLRDAPAPGTHPASA